MVEVGPTLRLWAIQDANWNVVALVNNAGSVVERFDYTPFGSVTQLNPNGSAYTGTNYNWVYLWQGGRLDTVTGNLQFRARDYSPVLMRWTTIDPIGLWGGDVNTYRTEGNDVVDTLDPSGFADKANNATVQGIDWSKGVTTIDNKDYATTTSGEKVQLDKPANFKVDTWCHHVTFGGYNNPVNNKFYAPTKEAVASMLADGAKKGTWKKVNSGDARKGDIVIWKANGDAYKNASANGDFGDGVIVHSATLVQVAANGQQLDSKQTLVQTKDGPGNMLPLQEAAQWGQQFEQFGLGKSAGIQNATPQNPAATYQIWRFGTNK
jgi:RHS repeat-associated protein